MEVAAHQKGSVWSPLKAGRELQGCLNQEGGSSTVPTTLPVPGAQVKWMGTRTPKSFEQGFWACDVRKDRNHQDLTWVCWQQSSDHQVGLRTGKERKHSQAPVDMVDMLLGLGGCFHQRVCI